MDASRVPLLQVLGHIEAELARGQTAIELDVLDPDHGRGRYAGEPVGVAGVAYLHRPLRVWLDLAERLGLRLCTPRPAGEPLVRLRFEILDRSARMIGDGDAGTEKYGTGSDFARIHKLEDPSFVVDTRDAIERVAPAPTCRVLALGCNTGDEIALLRELSPALREAVIVGVDHSASAIAVARSRFASARVELHVADVADLATLGLGRFDLVLSIGTLQSAGIDDRELLRTLVQDQLAPRGALILGLPNCRYIDGEVEYGARMKNFRQPELGLLVKDIAFYRKYLQQHHKQVFVTGKHYLLVTAVPTE